MRKAILVLTVLFFISTSINAQFQEGKSYAGPAIGLSFLGSTVSFGANYEYGMTLADIPGPIGVGALVRYWSYGTVYTYTDIIIAAQGNYHFVLDSKKLDPYIGLILGYDINSWSYDGPYSDYLNTTSGGFIAGISIGARYWLSPKMAVNARFGTGSNLGSTLDVGLDFKF
jgi:hypothetical protein